MPKMKKHKISGQIVHDVQSKFRAMQRVADSARLTLVQQENCTQPCTDLKTRQVFVQKPSPLWDLPRIRKWEGEVYHEVGHHAPEVTDTLGLMEEKGLTFQSLFGRCINAVDDYRNEHNNYKYYPGRDSSLSFAQGFYCTQGAKSLESADPSKIGKDQALLRDVLGWIYTVRSKWQPDLVRPAEWFNKYADGSKYSHLTPELEGLKTAEDVYNLARKLLEESPDHDPDEEEQKSRDAKGSDGDESEESDSKEGEPKGKGDKGEGDGPSEGEVSFKDLMGHSHTDANADPTKDNYLSIKYDHEPKDDYKPWDKMKIVQPNQMKTTSIPSEFQKYYEKGSSLASVARKVFQSRTQSKITHNHRSGRLDKRDLYRIPNGAKDIMIRREETVSYNNTVLSLLTDASGSMSGNKFRITTAAVALLNDAISPLNIPIQIAAFTERRSTGCQHFIVKRFSDRVNKDDIFEKYAYINRQLAQNADGESILWAYNELMKQKEKRKILIVLSDGLPWCDNKGDIYTYTKNVIYTIHKQIEIYGIGILDDTVEELYPESLTIKDTSQLEAALLNLIKDKIFS